MNPRVTAVLFALATLLGTFVYLHELRDGERGKIEKSTADRLFPDVDAEAIDAIELRTSDGKRARVERSDDGWRVLEPVSDVADAAVVDAMAGALEGLESEGQVEGAPDEAQFELGEQSATVRFEVGGRTWLLRVGRKTPVGASAYLQTRAGGPIFYVANWRLEPFIKSLTELRDRRPLVFDQAEVEHLVVRWSGGGVELEKRGERWWLLRPLEERADQQAIATLLSDLAYLRAEGFIDRSLAASDLGFDPPRFHVVLRGRTGEGERFDLGLDLGKLRGDRIAARSMGRLFELAAERLEDFPREVEAYRFKQLARFEAADARRFALRFVGPQGGTRRVEGVWSGGRWQTSPVAMAEGRAGALLAEVARLEAVGIAADSMGEGELRALGLSPPRVRLQVWGVGRSAADSAIERSSDSSIEAPASDEGALLADVTLGVVQSGRGWLARRADSAIVYRLPVEMTDRLPVDYDALIAHFVKPSPEGADAEDGDELDAVGDAGGAESGGVEPTAP